jgi:cytochrome c peroxidase
MTRLASWPCLIVALQVVGCRGAPANVNYSASEKRIIETMSPLPRLSADESNSVADDTNAAALGRRLFFDRRFSRNGTVSCATCHDPSRGWSNGAPMGRGIGTTRRHVPSIVNAAYNRWFFWDGRADSLWCQALQPMENRAEHGGSRLQFAHLVSDDRDLRVRYESIFGSLPDLQDRNRFPRRGTPVTEIPDDPERRAWDTMSQADRAAIDRVFCNLGKAIAAFERTLVSGSSPFDRFVQAVRTRDPAQASVIPPAAARGLKLFIGKANCRLCHSGPLLTDGEFHNTGIPFAEEYGPDPGRYRGIEMLRADEFNAAGPFSDDRSQAPKDKLGFLSVQSYLWAAFKTPSLRNVALTAPYMHDGRFATLKDVVVFYNTRQGAAGVGHHDAAILRPLGLRADEVDDLVLFLETLSGTVTDSGRELYASDELAHPGARDALAP